MYIYIYKFYFFVILQLLKTHFFVTAEIVKISVGRPLVYNVCIYLATELAVPVK